MSHNNIELATKMSNISIGPLNEDYKSIYQLINIDRTDLIKGRLKEILSTLKTDDKIYRFINSLVDILKSDLNNWKSNETIKTIFNELEDAYLSISSGKSDKAAMESLNTILENIFMKYTKEVEMQIKNWINNPEFELYPLNTILMNFTQLLDIKNYEPILYPMAYLVDVLLKLNHKSLQHIIIEFILHINHRLVNYLAVIPGNPVSKGLKESIAIYNAVRTNIVQLNYTSPEIITKALNILEHRSRFFGLTADAIPENENHGDYIVVDPLNTAFEDDDVYDDYENFLANLPS